MRKVLFAMAMALVSISASAQKGETAFGANLSYGTEIKNLGIGVKGQYGITDAIRAEAAFDYFLKKDGLSMWDVNLNVHYLIPIIEKFKVYPLAGVVFTNWKTDFAIDVDDSEGYGIIDDDADDSGSTTTSKFGANLGAGLQYDLTDKLSLNVEGKYQLISDFDQMVFSVGVAYKF